jgi:hypothetical protein
MSPESVMLHLQMFKSYLCLAYLNTSASEQKMYHVLLSMQYFSLNTDSKVQSNNVDGSSCQGSTSNGDKEAYMKIALFGYWFVSPNLFFIIIILSGVRLSPLVLRPLLAYCTSPR